MSSVDLFLEGRPRQRVREPAEPFRIGDRLYDGRWVVTQILPSPTPPPDLEVYARRSAFIYSVRDARTDGLIALHTLDEQAAVGDALTIGVDRWRVDRVRQDNSDLSEGTLFVSRMEPKHP